MSNYQDDVQETLTAAESVFMGLQSVTSELGHILDTVIFVVMTLTAESAVISDALIDQRSNAIYETVSIADSVIGSLTTATLVADSSAVSDSILYSTGTLLTSALAISDSVISTVTSTSTDTANIADMILSTRQVTSLMIEPLVISDWAYKADATTTTENLYVADTITQQLVASNLVANNLTAFDTLTSSQSITSTLFDTVHVSDSTTTLLQAISVVTEIGEIDGTAIIDGAYQQAWTANVANWAMTRYSPFVFTQLAVIDGKGYGITPDGVYALTGGAETLNGSLVFGKLDLSGDELVHPVGSLLEYAMSNGNAYMDVTESQSGADVQYTYTLPAKTADKLTNNRFIFGRGLRGRHFQFTLRIAAKSAEINDLRIDMTQTKRRV
jgi:hypothetical protein